MPNYGSIGASGVNNTVKFNKKNNTVNYSTNNISSSQSYNINSNIKSNTQVNNAEIYYSSESNAPQRVDVQNDNSINEPSKGEKIIQWLTENIFAPVSETQMQKAELDRQIAETTTATTVAVATSVVEHMVDGVSGMITTGAMLGEYQMLGAQNDIEMQLVTDEAMGKISSTVKDEQSARVAKEYSEAGKELHEYVVNSAQRTEDFKSKYIFNVNIPGTETTVREYIIEYSAIQEDTFLWEATGSIGQMIPVIVANTLIPGSGTAVFATSCFGNSLSAAYANGATDDEALTYAGLTTIVEVAIELIPGNAFGGVSKIGKIADSKIFQMMKNLTNDPKVKKVLSSYFAQFAFNATSEGVENVISDFAEPFVLKASYLNEEDLNGLITESYTLENFATDFLLGAVSSAGLQSISMASGAVSNIKTRESNNNISMEECQELYNEVPDKVKDILDKTDQRMQKDLSDPTKISKESINQSINEISKNGGIIQKTLNNSGIETGTILKENAKSVIKYDKVDLTAATKASNITTLEGSKRKSIFDIFKGKKGVQTEKTAYDFMPSLSNPAKANEYLLNPDTINEPIYGQQWGKEYVYRYCEGINNKGVLPYNVGKSLVSLLDGQSYVGVHKTSVSGQNLSNIMNEGLNVNRAGIMQGVVSNAITIDTTVKEIYYGQTELIEEIRNTSSFKTFEANISADKTILVKHPNGVNPLINVNGKVKVDPKYIVGYVPVENGVVGEIVYNKNYYDYKKESFSFNVDDFELILSKGLNDTLLGEKNGINKNPIIDQGIVEVHNFLIDNNPHYKKAWNAISNNPYVKCNLEITSKKDHYSYNGGIRISPNTFLSQSHSVNFHETGHALLSSNVPHYSKVVNKFNKILNNNLEMIKNRSKPLFEVAKRLHQTAHMMAFQVTTLKKMDPISNETFDYQNQLTEGIERNSGFSAVMDIYDAVTEGKTRDTETHWYGHGGSYYKRSFDQKFQEIFANFHELKCIDNPQMTDFCKNLIGNEMWNFLEKTYDDALNAKLTQNEANTTAALLYGKYHGNNSTLNSPTAVNSRVNRLSTLSYQERFNYIVQNMSQKYPNWINYLNTYISEKGNLNRITGYNNCRLVAKTIPLSEFTRMYNKLNITEILKTFSKDNMTTDRNLPNVVNQFLKRPGNAYHKLVNINTVQKSYPNKFEYDQFMNKFSEKNGYSIIDQNGYFKHIKYGVQPTTINHRLYINCEPTITYKFLNYFADACKQKGLSFHFKTAYLYNEIGNGHPINKSALTRSESAIIYASSSDIIEYINICKQIKMQHPELSFYEPPIAAGNIDGWLGYGKEARGRTVQVATNEGISNSFNSIRSVILERGIYDGIKSCIVNNTDLRYSNGSTIANLYANELYNSIVNKYPSMIDAHKQILYKELNNNIAHYMNIICSSEKPYWTFKAQLQENYNISMLVVDKEMINESLKNFHFNNTINDPGIYSYIKNGIKKHARHFYIDENNLYLSE